LPEVQKKSSHGFGVERCRKEVSRKIYTFIGIILKWTLKPLWKVGDWIHLAYEGYK